MHVIYNEPHYTRGPHSISKHCSLQSYCYSALNNDNEKIPYPMSALIFFNAHNFVLFVYFPQREFPCLVLSTQQPGSLTFSGFHVSFTSLKKNYRIPYSVLLLRSNSTTATAAV